MNSNTDIENNNNEIQINNSKIQNDVYKSIELFEKERNDEKQIAFQRVVRFGGLLMFSGLLIYFILNFLSFYSIISDNALLLIGVPFLAVFVTGILIISTVPYEQYNFDDFMMSNLVVRIGLSTVCLLCSITLFSMPPYFGSLNLILCSIGMFLTPWIEMKFSFLWSIWLITIFFSLMSISIFCSIHAAEDLDKYSLMGDVFGELGNSTKMIKVWGTCAIWAFIWFISFIFILKKTSDDTYENIKNNLKVSNRDVFHIIYGYLFGAGVFLTIQGVLVVIIAHEPVEKRESLPIGIMFCIPVVILLCLGRQNVFNFMAKRFDSDKKRLNRDGAFIALLLEKTNLQTGQIWWVHRTVPEIQYEYFDKLRNWKKGEISQITTEAFTVKIEEEDDDDDEEEDDDKEKDLSILVKQRSSFSMMLQNTKSSSKVFSKKKYTTKVFPLSSSSHITTDAILHLAQTDLRCIDWLTIINNPELFKTSVRDDTGKKSYDYSRPIHKNEIIDYFLSHSWHDNMDKKLDHLKIFSEEFKTKNGRYPTFWFDKVCINQDNIGDGLKVLPINIMACDSLLVLFGETYAQRLWCIWELYTHFSFRDLENSLKKIKIISLESNAEDSLMKSLSHFDIKNAKCYDPNEEAKLLTIIYGGGIQRFHDRIHTLASSCLPKKSEKKVEK